MESTTTVETINAAASPAPVSETDRIQSIDVLRGIALLGILLMNIPSFSMPNYFSEAFRSNPGDINFWVRTVIIIFFEGKMRALFSMVFGAGILLFISKKEKTGTSATWLFYRRMAWLVVFGLIHAHIILWSGDILYSYGLIGMIAFLFRKAAPKYLVWGVPIVAVIGFFTSTQFYQEIRTKRLDYLKVAADKNAGKILTVAQQKILTEWREIEKEFIPNKQDAAENTRIMKSDYKTIAAKIRKEAWKGQTTYFLYQISDPLALMLLGIALFKWGFLTCKWSRKQYLKVALIGYGIGLPLVLYDSYYAFYNFPTMAASLAHMDSHPIVWIDLIYPAQRIFLVMAHVSVILILYKSGIFQRFLNRLAAVGQMAFTNYISHSVVCTLIFYGYGLNKFATFEYYQIFFVVFAIWIFQLIISPIWLRNFYFGPLEWLWRSLTYWKLQPMKKPA